MTPLVLFSQKVDVLEQVFVHTNASELIVGETLYFSAFVKSQATGKISEISKILYVEILDQDQKSVYRTKLIMEDGRGHGEFFIPSTFSSGNYHLVAYTRWMMNFQDYYHTPLIIINPYEEPNDVLKKEQVKTSVEFAPEGGSFVKGFENRLIIKVKGEKNIGGRLVENGETISKIVFDKAGYSEVKINPGDKKYQLILETSTGFSFFDLPKPCKNCSGLKLNKAKEDLIFDVMSNDSSRKTCEFQIHSPQEVLYSRKLRINSSEIIDSKSMPSGLLKAVMLMEEKEVASRLFWNGNLEKQNKELVASEKFGKSSTVEYKMKLDERATLAVSVVAKGYEGLTLDDASFIQNSMASPHYWEFIDLANMDRVLSIAQWKYKPLDLFDDTIKFLPEIDRDIISGSLVDEAGIPIAGESIGLFLCGSNYQIDFTKTNEKGYFNLLFDPQYSGENNFVRTLEDSSSYVLSIENEYYDQFQPLPQKPIELDSQKVKKIIRKSIHNQIENAYFEREIMPSVGLEEQFDWNKTLKLDDYTRFPTMKDMLIEYIPHVVVSKFENNYNIKINYFDIDQNGGKAIGGAPLILINGAVSKPEEMFKLSPYLVESLHVKNEKYYFGSIMVNGILFVKTFESEVDQVKNKGESITLPPPQKKLYYRESRAMELSRFPDYRTMLHWNANITLDKGEHILQFKTSRVSGDYLISVNGVSASGKDLSFLKLISIE